MQAASKSCEEEECSHWYSLVSPARQMRTDLLVSSFDADHEIVPMISPSQLPPSPRPPFNPRAARAPQPGFLLRSFRQAI